MTAVARACAVLAVALAIAGCDERPGDLTGPSTPVGDSFSSIQSVIFESRDAATGRPECISCHNATLGPFNGSLDLSRGVAYANLVNRPSADKPGAVLVVPGNPESSYLVHKLEGRAGIVGLRMPVSGPFLSESQIAAIRSWIARGAPND
jgi:hypothetical protein